MEKLLARLERRFGRYAIEQLTVVIVGGTAAVFLISMIQPSFLNMLTLDLHQVQQGQIWRLFTYLFIPGSHSPIWILFSLYMTWFVGTQLEHEWGAFKFNCFYLFGMIGTTLAAALAGRAVGNDWFHLSLYLAFATLFPNFEVFLFFVLRIKVKWLGLLMVFFLLVSFVLGGWGTRGAILAAFSNYFLFFGEHWWTEWKLRKRK